MYDLVKAQLKLLLKSEDNFIANAGNLSALLYHALPDLNWVGFYIISGEGMLLGPFNGKVACTRIRIGDGVCGSAAQKRETIIVDDVHQFPGHIACDSDSRSEIVIPMIKDGKLYGVFDVDAPVTSRFTPEDRLCFEEYVGMLLESSDMEAIYRCYNK